MNVGIGGNGTVNSVTNAPMGLLSLANIVEQKGKDEYPGFSQKGGIHLAPQGTICCGEQFSATCGCRAGLPTVMEPVTRLVP